MVDKWPLFFVRVVVGSCGEKMAAPLDGIGSDRQNGCSQG